MFQTVCLLMGLELGPLLNHPFIAPVALVLVSREDHPEPSRLELESCRKGVYY